ncbi:carboxy-terminal domain phosphatase-like protein [Medicago truncatula]|uniref:RNA polymerase II C-terminal domain phosphatase-like n=1 Tax=Medicago truncatula TaxID=3880 RepID=A0A072V8S3_MEDTR|nr:carboxy-terminal domain phosphatase-like protein [Medicago truncatula]
MSHDETEFPDSTDSSGSTDEFIQNLEDELDDDGSDNSSSDEEAESEDSRIKRLKSDSTSETETSTSAGTAEQKLVSSVNVDVCMHPGSFGGICIHCGQKVDGESGVSFGYIRKGLKLDDKEISRVRGIDVKNLLNRRKLCLVLDLDHTLLNTTSLHRLSPEEMHLKTHTDSLEDISKGSLFMLAHMQVMTKLRPFVRTFLKQASEMFEMYIYTMGDRQYSLEMARLLDPQEEYFKDKVISREDGTQKNVKDLDLVLGTENSILILDDKEEVWPKYRDNLILMERYHFFNSSCQDFGLQRKSLVALHIDENETDGALAKILEVLRQINYKFFDELQGDLVDRDVRQVLSSFQGEVLRGCVIIFSLNFRGDLRKLRRIAERLGATCLKKHDPTVTHVVATDFVTKESRWAVKEKKFLVNRRWLEAANFFLQKQPEENFLCQNTLVSGN